VWADWLALFATGGIRALSYSGPQNLFGGDVGTVLGTPTTQCYGLVVATSLADTWGALKTITCGSDPEQGQRIKDIGSLTLGGVLPSALTVIAASMGVSGGANVDLQASIGLQLSAMAGFAPMGTLDFSALLTLAAQVVANVQMALTLGVTPPSVNMVVDLNIMLNALLAIVMGVYGLFVKAGVRLLTYDGPQNLFGSELSTALGSDTSQCYGLVLTTQTAWSAIGQVFRVTA